MHYFAAFVAGLVSTLTFHQGLLALLYKTGKSPRPAYVMTPVPPLGVPSVLSLAFWGGVWGVVLLPLLSRWSEGPAYWLAWLVAGAIGPSVVALFVVLPLKGKPVAAGGNPAIILGALLVNAVWGLGTALLLRLLGQFV